MFDVAIAFMILMSFFFPKMMISKISIQFERTIGLI